MYQINNRGISLIEVLTVVAIILILTAAVAVSPDRSTVDLDNAARQLATDLRRAQNMAMSSDAIHVVAGIPNVPCGFGIYTISSDGSMICDSYIRYYKYTGLDCSALDFRHGFGTDYDQETVTFENITIEHIMRSVFFTSPKGEVYFSSGSGETFILTAPNGATREVEITDTGLIEIR